MTMPLFLLRAVQAGISISDMDILTIGEVIDMYMERSNDNETYAYVAGQDDFDRF